VSDNDYYASSSSNYNSRAASAALTVPLQITGIGVREGEVWEVASKAARETRYGDRPKQHRHAAVDHHAIA